MDEPVKEKTDDCGKDGESNDAPPTLLPALDHSRSSPKNTRPKAAPNSRNSNNQSNISRSNINKNSVNDSVVSSAMQKKVIIQLLVSPLL